MLIRSYLQQPIRALVAACIIGSGILTFGQPELFDRLFLAVLVILLIINTRSKDTNTLGVLLILLFERISDELIFIAMEVSGQKILVYCISAMVLYKSRDDKLTHYIAPLVLLTFIAEIYWLMSGYPAPLVHYYIGLVVLNILTRKLLFMRVPLTQRWVKKNAKLLTIDWQLYKLAKWFTIAIAIVLIEFLIRHTTAYQAIYIYMAYPYLLQGFTLITLLIIGEHIVNASPLFKA
jgi:hypothetical protein